MARVITYECMECGCEIIVSGAEESVLQPIYCCGSEVAKISSSLKQTEVKKTKKKTSTKVPGKLGTKAEGRTVRKTSVQRKSSGR